MWLKAYVKNQRILYEKQGGSSLAAISDKWEDRIYNGQLTFMSNFIFCFIPFFSQNRNDDGYLHVKA